MTALPLSRRMLLKAGGAVIVSFGIPSLAQAASNQPTGAPRTLDPAQVDGFLAFHADGTVSVFSGKVDLGTGLRIAIRQMAAEELGIGVDQIALIEGDTALTPDQGPTAGSTGVARGGVQIRQAAATARQALIGLAAGRLKRPAGELDLIAGEVRPVAGGPADSPGVTVASLIGDRLLDLPIDAKAPLRDPDGYKLVGQSLPRPDVPEKVMGRHVYVHDFSLPGMLHGRVIRPPAIDARLETVDETSIAGLNGVRIIRIKDFLGVVAEDEWTAVRAADRLKATWSGGQHLPVQSDLYSAIRGTAVARDAAVVSKGDPAVLRGSSQIHTATYQWPIQSHASLGPSCAVADITPDEATIWTASQSTHRFRLAFAKFLDLPAERVRLIYLDGSGCYGMNGHDDAAADAALMSRAVGRPVRVQWMRADEHGWDPKGPPQLLDVSATLDSEGRITAWRTEAWLPLATAGLPNIPLLGPQAAGIGQVQGLSAGLIDQNTDPPYAVANVEATIHWLKSTPLRPSNIRAPGKIANTFAIEGFTDELAAVAGVDPVEFRRRGLSDPRGLDVLRRAATLFGWEPRPSPAPARNGPAEGRGIAYVHYKHSENYVALAMAVTVDPKSGAIRVTRVACSHDCGLVINPDALKNQIEGAIVQTLSRGLHEEVTFDHDRVTSLDWAGYPILTFPELPEITIDLVERRHEPPLGGGEAAAAPVAAALANAVFDAIGIRLRTVPFTPDRVKAAIKERGA
ncbi:MAG TPA: molybdopterin cofactor-binding domain-containing protein [Stellaceae bacterium]|nr:molybdopterin cofactor-binding domain-containing protein [Stellaceae bacterium]